MSSHPNYRPDIDGLRAIAVLLVIGFHAFGIQAGFIGVDLFFVISGFLISSIIFTDLQEGKLNLLEFYHRRIRRIFPALLTVLLFCFIFGWFTLLADEFSILNKHIAAGLAFVSNLVLLGESGYFDSSSHSKLILHLWSLGIEEQFYIFWPLLLLLAWKLHKKSWFFPALLIAISLVSFLLNIVLIQSHPSATFYLPFTRFWELSIGAGLAYRVMVIGKPCLIFDSPNLNSFLGLALLIVANAFMNDRSPFPGWWAVLPTLSAVLFISAGYDAWFNRRILGNRTLVWIGLISYPLYLWHWPLLTFARILDGGRQSSSLIRIAMVSLAILLAWLTYRFIEKPIRFHPKTDTKFFFTPTSLLALGGVFFLVSGWVYLNQGMPNRSAANLAVLNEGDIGHDEFRSYLHTQPNYCEYKDSAPLVCAKKFSDFKRVIAVVGDSHAEHILLGLTEAMPQTAFLLFDTNQTLPFVSSALSNHFFDVIKSNSKIDSVLLVAYWNLRKQLISPESNYLKEIISTAEKLSEQGKKVFLVDGIPNFSFLPSKCKYDWPFLRTQQCTESNHFNKQHAQFYPDFMAAQNASPILIIELKSFFCEGDTCAMAKDGKLFFRDDNHLGINGSRFIAPLISENLNPHIH